jgi:molecular chaperone GrpE (heat shock protein)
MRTTLLVEDHLFREFAQEKAKFEDEKKRLQRELQNANDSLKSQEALIKSLDDFSRAISSKDPNTIEAKFAEYNRKVALQDVNLIR